MWKISSNPAHLSPMSDSQPESRHCYSARLLRPFGRALRQFPDVPEAVIASIDALDPDERVPVATTHELLAGAIALSGDPDLGLRAAGTIERGEFSALEYAASTATDAREALQTIARYMHLINDALTIRIEVQDEVAAISLDSAVVLPRAAEAFEVAAFFAAFRHRAPEVVEKLSFDLMLTHEAPEDASAYRDFFSERATIHFGAPFCGWTFPASVLDMRVAEADPHLHELIRKHADMLLQELPRAESFTARVRELITEGLAGGKAGVADAASALHVSQRTLARRLDEEGTSFKELTDQVRRSLALRYVGQTDLAFSEIAFLLGFSQVSAFHRAFKRWTDQTPREYRSAHRG
jgi:AraC-like DNA-binding protein